MPSFFVKVPRLRFTTSEGHPLEVRSMDTTTHTSKLVCLGGGG